MEKTSFFTGFWRKRTVLAIVLVLAVSLLGVSLAMATLLTGAVDASDGNQDGLASMQSRDWQDLTDLTCPDGTSGNGCDVDLPTGQNDNAFGQGSKEDTEVPTVVSGSIPNNKSDLLRFYVWNEKISNKDMLYLGWVRVNDPKGTTNMDFEFNQCSQGLSANNTTCIREAGDLLIRYDLSKGGSVPVLSYHRWVTAASAGGSTPADVCEASNSFPCWDMQHDLTGNFEGAVNDPDSITDYFVGGTLSPRTFGEAAVNLTDSGIFPANQCVNFGSAFIKSRSSDSFSAELKDFIAPLPVNVSNCGSLTIVKNAVPDDAQDFAFTGTGSIGNFSLDDDADPTLPNQEKFTNLFSGGYTVTESLPVDGWDLTDISCTAGSPSYDMAAGSATITLGADDNVTCTFTNTQRGKIIVAKETDPDGSTQSFDFTASYDGDGFSLTDGQSNDSGFLVAGTYSVSETVPTGWDLTSAVCSDGSDPSSIGLSAGETVTCTFTNTQRGKIIVAKETVPDGSTQSFDFTASYVGNGFSLTDGQSNDSGFLTPGNYSVSETVPTGWDLTSAVCSDGSDPSSIGLGAGETVTCTFTNTQRGKIIVAKETVPDGSTQSFDFTASYDADGFSLTDGQSNDSGFLLAGNYSVSETVPTGWDLTSAVCSDGSDPSSIGLGAGETVTCTFTNTQLGTITINKTDDDDPAQPLAGATFTLYTDNSPFDGAAPHGDEDTATTMSCTTDANGTCSIENIPLGVYWVVETTTPTGYQSAADQYASVTAGAEISLNFVDPRLFKIIVLVCQQSNNQLYASSVTLDGETLNSLASGGGGSLTDAELCDLGGAKFEDKTYDTYPASVNIPQ